MLESPFFVDIVLYAIYVLLCVAVLLTVWSTIRSLRRCGGTLAKQQENGVPKGRVAWLTAGVLVVTLAVTWFAASTQPLSINGKAYTDTFWLRISDMLINTTLVLIVLVVIAVIYSNLKSQISNSKSP